MANYKLDKRMVLKMTEGDKAVLLYLYLHRCLTPSLIIKYLYRCDEVAPEIADHRLDAMILDKLIEAVPYGGIEDALFLTPFGVRTVVSLYGDQLTRQYKPGSNKATKLPTYWDIKMCHANINHQMHLNQFVLEFEDYARGVVNYEYYDAKFMPPASDFIMPDGMIVLPDRLLFLEMDMGTETVKRLAQKWNSYRMFLRSPRAYYEKKTITMFFILDGIARIQLRQKTTMRSLMTYLGSQVDNKFEVYFEPPERCHEVLRTRYLSANTELSVQEKGVLIDVRGRHGFRIFRPNLLQELGCPEAYYIKRLDAQGKLSIIGERPQEFVMELWLDQRISVLQSLVSHAQFEKKMRNLTNREVPYLLVVPSIVWANKIPQITRMPIPEDIFFTTPERLRARSGWHKALFRIDQIKNLAHFQDDSLRDVVHERRLTKL